SSDLWTLVPKRKREALRRNAVRSIDGHGAKLPVGRAAGRVRRGPACTAASGGRGTAGTARKGRRPVPWECNGWHDGGGPAVKRLRRFFILALDAGDC